MYTSIKDITESKTCSTPLVDVENVRVTFQERPALHDLDLRIHVGEHIWLNGRNGSGKSTLLRLLRGEVYPDQGTRGHVTWHTPLGPDSSPISGREMVYLASPAILELYVRQGWNLSGEDLILSGLSDGPLLYSDPGEDMRGKARALARDMGVEHLLERSVPSMSQGQLCLMFLARASLGRPPLLLLDEFSNGLDSASMNNVQGMLENLARVSTIVIATHRPDSLPSCLCREILLDKGRILQDKEYEPPRKRHHRPAMLPTDFSALALSNSSYPDALPDLDNAPPLIRIHDATVYVEREPVLHDIFWELRPGEQWIVSGSNGAGKSTFLRLLSGDLHPAAGGSIAYNLPEHGGHISGKLNLGRAVRLVSDRSQAAYRYNIDCERLVLSGFEESIGLYRPPLEEEKVEAHKWMERLGVASLARMPLRGVSTGQLRALFLARALVGEPAILLLDEPFSGLDIPAREGMVEILDRLIASGMHLVLVTHHDDDILPAMTHMTRMDMGRIVHTAPRGGHIG